MSATHVELLREYDEAVAVLEAANYNWGLCKCSVCEGIGGGTCVLEGPALEAQDEVQELRAALVRALDNAPDVSITWSECE